MLRRSVLFGVLLLVIGVGVVVAQDDDSTAIFDTPFVVAALGENAQTWSIVLIDLRLDGPLRLTDDIYDDIAPLVSADGRYIVYLRGDARLDESFEYYLIDQNCWPDCDPTPLPEEANEVHDLRWSPVGHQLIGWGPANAVWLIDVEKNTVERVMGGTWNANPAWSPDGKMIVVSSDVVPPNGVVSDDIQVFPVGRDLLDAERVNLTYSGLFIEEIHPTFSPDGAWIAYATRNFMQVEGDPIDRETAALIVMDADCIDEPDTCLDTRRMLSRAGQAVGEYAWSPDGKYIAYVEGDAFGLGDGLGTIWVVEVANGDPWQLTKEKAYQSLTWAPNSQILVFEHSTDTSLNVEFMAIQGQDEPGAIISGFRAAAMPYWAPQF